MIFNTNKEKGRAGLSLGIAYFGANGYYVNLPLNDTQWYDFVIEKDGVFQTVQCKSTGTNKNEISLRNMGGTNGKEYDSVLNHNVDLLFCVDKNQNLFVIPMADIRQAGNINRIRLYIKSPTSKYNHNKTFDTSKYIVKI